jgi:phospholipase/carboxylesterase
MEMDDPPLVHVSAEPETEADGPAPAVVVLHGRGADEQDLLPIARRLPDTLHVLSVRAPDRLQGGYTWYELDLSAGGLHASQPDDEDFRRSLDLLDEFVGRAVDSYDLDPERVGLLGFSQGAITSLAALIERPERYAWVAVLHGYLAASHEDRAGDAADTPVFVGAGEDDRIIPAERAERAATILRDAGVDVRFERYPVGHGTSLEEIEDVVEWVGERLR